jgi:hypothetical protein
MASTRRLHAELCPDVPQPEWGAHRVYTKAHFDELTRVDAINEIVLRICDHFRPQLAASRTVIGPPVVMDRRRAAPLSRETRGLLADVVEERSVDRAIFPLVDVTERGGEHAMVCIAATSGEGGGRLLLLLDPNGGEGYPDEAYADMRAFLVASCPTGVGVTFSRLNTPPMNDAYDRTLYLRDVKRGLRLCRVYKRGFCAYWVFAYLIDICCSRTRLGATGHFRRMGERACGARSLPTVAQRHNCLLYLRGVLTWIVDNLLSNSVAEHPSLARVRRSASAPKTVPAATPSRRS